MGIEVVQNVLAEEIDLLMEQINNRFANSCGRNHFRNYIIGLMSQAERKNGWQLSEALGLSTPYAIQQFLYRGNWNPDELRDDLRNFVIDRLGDEEAALIIDETGFLKKGKMSIGVKRQYSGTAGRVENCQIGVFMTYASKAGYAFIDRELYIPKDWTNDDERMRAAGAPENVQFRPKTEIALDMLKAAEGNNVPFSWVTADCVYGDCRAIGTYLESIGKGYVLAVSGKFYCWIGTEQRSVSSILQELPDDGWKGLSIGTGTKGERSYDFLMIPINSPDQNCPRHLLIRRNIDKPDEFRAFICSAPSGTPIHKLARIAGIRWTIEQSIQEAKGLVGLDHYEVRSFSGWYKHITLSCFALALLAVIKIRVNGDILLLSAFEPSEESTFSAFKKGRGF